MKTPCEVMLAIELWEAQPIPARTRTVEQVAADAYRLAVLGRAAKRLAEKKCNDPSYSERDDKDLIAKEQEIQRILLNYRARYERDSLIGRVITRRGHFPRATCLL